MSGARKGTVPTLTFRRAESMEAEILYFRHLLLNYDNVHTRQ
jgi:hypothetical protein